MVCVILFYFKIIVFSIRFLFIRTLSIFFYLSEWGFILESNCVLVLEEFVGNMGDYKFIMCFVEIYYVFMGVSCSILIWYDIKVG